MAQWGQNDNTSNSVIWAPATVKQAPNADNRDNLYQNNTPDAFVEGTTVGMYGVDEVEVSMAPYQLTSVSIVTPGAGVYVPGEILEIDDTGATSEADATITVVSTTVVAATVDEGGTEYSNGDIVTVVSGVGTEATLEVETDSDGIVTNLTVVSGGQYTENPTVSGAAVSGGDGSNLTVDLELGISEVSINSVGSYSVLPTDVETNSVSGSDNGTGAEVAVTFAQVGAGAVTHTGWVVRRVGTGGRAGRIQTEVLVAGGIVTDNSDDDDVFPGGVS